MEEKVFNEEIQKYETSTKGHADEFNKRQDKLLENDKYLKSHLEDMKKIIVSETIPDVSKRVPNTIYCKITDVQSTNTTNALKVSPTMGLKVEQ